MFLDITFPRVALLDSMYYLNATYGASRKCNTIPFVLTEIAMLLAMQI